MFEEVIILQEGSLVLKKEAEELRHHTCAVSGTVEQVEAFIKDKKVIQTQQLVGMMTAYIFGNRQEAMSAGLQVEGVPIQELMIHLTEGEKGVS